MQYTLKYILLILYGPKSQSYCLSWLYSLYSDQPLNLSRKKTCNNNNKKKNYWKTPQEEPQQRIAYKFHVWWLWTLCGIFSVFWIWSVFLWGVLQKLGVASSTGCSPATAQNPLQWLHDCFCLGIDGFAVVLLLVTSLVNLPYDPLSLSIASCR